MFSPEFRNRVDSKISFHSLDKKIMERIVDKFLMELEDQLDGRKVEMNVTDRARHWLAEKGYDPTYGARPLARVIQSEIKEKIADEMLFGSLVKGGKVTIDLGDDALTFDFG